MRRAELDRIRGKVEQRGYTLIPLRLYFKEGWAKVEIALAKGRKHEDRRDAIVERETKRELDRAMSRKRR
jgi:SsrA-binding protein